jgi:hypothetical protein
MNKPDPQSFAEKISPEQHEQLIDWLADHTYSEVRDLVASPPPGTFISGRLSSGSCAREIRSERPEQNFEFLSPFWHFRPMR